MSDQICFLAQDSIFYLPEKALNDEQMLELIDFYAKRDYSVTAQGQKDADIINASVDDVTEISQDFPRGSVRKSIYFVESNIWD